MKIKKQMKKEKKIIVNKSQVMSMSMLRLKFQRLTKIIANLQVSYFDNTSTSIQSWLYTKCMPSSSTHQHFKEKKRLYHFSHGRMQQK